MKLELEQAKKLAAEINALAPKSASVVMGNSMLEVTARITHEKTGNSARWNSFGAAEGSELNAAKIVAKMQSQLAERAKGTRAAIRAENEE